ncbi:MAG: hypothetical protein Greene041662_993 [Candidatus Peregrinibacteria bacterium Greene0416_62]|nr:MAG: hypothetical protein Greene041662_993 [Candidatus Peregrinibacteria bacterium Greene0416_62]TSD00501.1 MAG: hypothetical protein Greene101449_111 [Candidatus Peregrinibacteria bacterium Greene1014_49]
MFRWLTSAAILLTPIVANANAAPSQTRGTTVPLLEPLRTCTIPILCPAPPDINADGGALFVYINQGLFWLQTIAIGIVILWLLFAGILIMISGNDQGKRTQAKEHAIAAIIGLLILFLFGFILSVLNERFFIQ